MSNRVRRLRKANPVKSLSYYLLRIYHLLRQAVHVAENSTGDGYQSDGHLLVTILHELLDGSRDHRFPSESRRPVPLRGAYVIVNRESVPEFCFGG